MRGMLYLMRKLIDNRITRSIKRISMRARVASSERRERLNREYRRLDDDQRARFWALYAKIFRGKNVIVEPGEWKVEFAGRVIRLPLDPDHIWQHWDSAVSIIGHDIEIKQTYANLLSSHARPDVFLDVGANYGTHSLLFLAAGISTISIEPNPNCATYFREACSLNGFTGIWEAFAAGEKEGEIELVFPVNDTWLGSVCPEVVEALKRVHDVVTVRVPMKRLDALLDRLSTTKKLLIKIDVEGLETECLRGGAKLIMALRPIIIFETNDTCGRSKLFSELDDLGYQISMLPWQADAAPTVLNVETFLTSRKTNFLALPRDALTELLPGSRTVT